MTQNRNLMLALLAVGGVVLLGGAALGVQSVLEGFDQKDRQIAALEQDVSTTKTKIAVLDRNQAKFRQWQAIGLPGDRTLALEQYRAFLSDLCVRHFPKRDDEPRKWAITAEGSGSTRNAAATVTPITVSVQLTSVPLQQLVGFLTEFHHTPLPHQIRNLALTAVAAGQETRLDATLRVEALPLGPPERRTLPAVTSAARTVASLIGAAPGMGAMRPLALGALLATNDSGKLAARYHPERDFAELPKKNVFAGLVLANPEAGRGPQPDRETLKFVQITGITTRNIGTLVLATEASIRNRLTNSYANVRKEGGQDTFRVVDTREQVVLEAKVLNIDLRHLELVATMGRDTKKLTWHVGEFLETAWREGKRLTAAERKELGLDPEDEVKEGDEGNP